MLLFTKTAPVPLLIKGATKQTQLPLVERAPQDAALQIPCCSITACFHSCTCKSLDVSVGSYSGLRLVASEHIGISPQLPAPVLVNVLPKHLSYLESRVPLSGLSLPAASSPFLDRQTFISLPLLTHPQSFPRAAAQPEQAGRGQ